VGHCSALSYRFLPELRDFEPLELRELEELLPDDELRDDEEEGLDMPDRPDELRDDEERAAGALRGREDEEDETPLLRDPEDRDVPRVMMSQTDVFREDDPLLSVETALPFVDPDLGRVNSMDGVLPVGAERPTVPRSPAVGVLAPEVVATDVLVVPDDREPS